MVVRYVMSVSRKGITKVLRGPWLLKGLELVDGAKSTIDSADKTNSKNIPDTRRQPW